MRELLSIGGIGIGVEYPDTFNSIKQLKSYLSKCKNDVHVSVTMKESVQEIVYPFSGEDLFCKYYGDGENLQILLKGARGIPSGMFHCRNHMRKISFEIYEQMQMSCRAMDYLMKILPMRQILKCFNAFILHSSRIAIDETAVLFTGNSGVGKTTQALLWEKYENALHLCNDRTILRLEDSDWQTYGYIEDGTEPIANPVKVPLGAIVVLKQGKQNIVYKINGKTAVRELIGQVFVDKWDYTMLELTLNNIIYLISKVPIYYMECVPDKTAVETLKTVLKQECIIK